MSSLRVQKHTDICVRLCTGERKEGPTSLIDPRLQLSIPGQESGVDKLERTIDIRTGAAAPPSWRVVLADDWSLVDRPLIRADSDWLGVRKRAGGAKPKQAINFRVTQQGSINRGAAWQPGARHVYFTVTFSWEPSSGEFALRNPPWTRNARRMCCKLATGYNTFSWVIKSCRCWAPLKSAIWLVFRNGSHTSNLFPVARLSGCQARRSISWLLIACLRACWLGAAHLRLLTDQRWVCSVRRRLTSHL